MTEDHASRARRLEAALDWEGAEAAWRLAGRENSPGAVEGLNRARRVRVLSTEMLHEAQAALDDGDLRAAAEPLRSLREMLPRDHPAVHALRHRWFDRRAATNNRIWRAELWAAFPFAAVGLAACFALGGGSIRLILLGTILLHGAACAILRTVVPSLRRPPPVSAIRARKPTKRRRRRAAQKGEAPQPGPGTSRIDKWRRAAEREKEDYLS